MRDDPGVFGDYIDGECFIFLLSFSRNVSHLHPLNSSTASYSNKEQKRSDTANIAKETKHHSVRARARQH